jgi:hypothetical protein
MKKAAAILLILLNVMHVQAQMLTEIGESFRKKPKFFFNFTQYNSFINRESANVSGIRAGLEFNEKTRLALGYNWLYSDIVDKISISRNDVTYQTNGQLRFNYLNSSFEYEFYNNYPWHISVPLVLGSGGAHYEYIDRFTHERVTTKNFPVVLFEPSVNAQYNIIDWVGIAGGLGYRVALNSSKEFKKNFNSPVYVIQLKFFFDAIYKEVFPNGLLHKQKK